MMLLGCAACAALLGQGAVLVAAHPARGAPCFPAAYPGVIAATGDARCGWQELSQLGPALFGAIIIAPLILYPHLLETLGFNLDFYARSVQEGPTDNVRENTISQIINHLLGSGESAFHTAHFDPI